MTDVEIKEEIIWHERNTLHKMGFWSDDKLYENLFQTATAMKSII